MVDDGGMTLATPCDACGRPLHRDVVALRFATLSVAAVAGGGIHPKVTLGAQQTYLVCVSCASYVQACVAALEDESDADSSRIQGRGIMTASFAACDLCYQALGARASEVQISPARMVQLTGEGKVAHRSTGLRSLRLCVSCGDYLASGFEWLREAYGPGESAPERMAG